MLLHRLHLGSGIWCRSRSLVVAASQSPSLSTMPSKASDYEGRRADWQHLYSTRLPSLARAKDSAQKKWPVTLDHCFGRIILDRVVGDGNAPWTQVLKGPAIKTMSDEQIEACIDLGERIANGEVDLVELDEQSLKARGKKSKAKTTDSGSPEESKSAPTKRKREPDQLTGSEDQLASRRSKGRRTGSEDGSVATSIEGSAKEDAPGSSTQTTPDAAESANDRDDELAAKAAQTESLDKERELINESSLADYRKRVLLTLCQVPKGRFTTYAAMSNFLQSSPRAVGNAMRNNPFAPAVPCHRVLAADGKIGGYCGQWGEGDLIKKKRALLREEGIKFDGKGKVVGGPFKGFVWG